MKLLFIYLNFTQKIVYTLEVESFIKLRNFKLRKKKKRGGVAERELLVFQKPFVRNFVILIFVMLVQIAMKFYPRLIFKVILKSGNIFFFF